MKKIAFVVHQKGTQGSYLNHLDLQQYLKYEEGYRVTFYCENVKKLYEVIESTRRDYEVGKGEVKVIRKDIIEPGVVVTDFKTLIMAEKLKLFVICKKLIIMDSIELTYYLKNMKNARFYYDFDIYQALRSFYAEKIVFLMPPSSHRLFKSKHPDLESRVFFKKINVDMLNIIDFEDRDGYFFRWDDCERYKDLVESKFGPGGVSFEPEWMEKSGWKIPLKYNEANHLFDYKTLIYRRRKYLAYQEQFGRLIFEYILLGKKVYFIGPPFTGDGLTDYLTHYNIKFKGNEVITTKEELEKKMQKYTDRPWRTDD